MSDLLTTFRRLHEGPRVLCLANVWDAGSARLVESLGVEAVATTSAGVAWSLGYADDRNMPAAAAIAAAQNIARVLSVPLSVDIEHGYSTDPLEVGGYTAQLVDSGVVGVNIEDGGDEPTLLAAKIAAIKDAVSRGGGDVFVNARTDVYLRGLASEQERVAEVLARASLYRDAGADGLFVPGLCSAQEIREVAAGAGLPLNVMDWTDVPSTAELEALGVRRFSAGSGIAQTVWGVTRELAQAFATAGDVGPLSRHVMDYGAIQQLFSAN